MHPASPPPADNQAGFGPPVPGYGPAPLPTSVRAARVVAFTIAVLAVAVSVLAGQLDGPRTAGAVLGANLLNLVIGCLAFRFASGRSGVRVTCIVLAALQILFTLGAMARTAGSGLLPLAADITLIVLMTQSSAKAWFQRDR
ncbi:hypothetical protein [Streptomyces sp. NRRL F-5053]|uniref:hypothetical protein n=1 Tax=Streptomyces sp. NRRL F-5053 TaxID=1463854 RepID=UPI0004C63DC5|nr:hypothetical protein [Streptomyces sp. NRRL F-5053]